MEDYFGKSLIIFIIAIKAALLAAGQQIGFPLARGNSGKQKISGCGACMCARPYTQT
jgi:hypothetical protein